MTTPSPNTNLRDYVASWIRTVVPVGWGMLLTWLSSLIPAAGKILNSEAALGANVVVAGVITIIWYSIFRKIESHLPPWLTTIVIGANSQPTYVTPPDNGNTVTDEQK